MSTVSAEPDCDFWEFVCCAQCHLPIVSEQGGLTVPFWLTECGHVVCNNHLKRDQSCISCSAQPIQVMPLQPNMDEPMSSWFKSIPAALDSVAFAAKFQFGSMARQIRYYKAKYQKQRSLSDQLKKANDALAAENSELHQRHNYQQYSEYQDQQEPAQYVNSNGKRRMTHDPHEYVQHRPQTSSSGHSSNAIGPNRLTIPAGQTPPAPLRRRQVQPPEMGNQRPHPTQSERPGTSTFAANYAYNAPQGQTLPPQLSHAELAPKRSKGHGQRPDSRSMPPPPAPGTSKQMFAEETRNAQSAFRQQARNASQSTQPLSSSHLPSLPFNAAQSSRVQRQPNRFVPTSDPTHEAPPSSNKRFIPPTPVNDSSRRFAPSLADNANVNQRMPSRAAPAPTPSSQRKPFVPRSHGAFG